MRILGVANADDYLRLAGYLDGLSIVKRVQPVFATGNTLELDLDLATGIGGFARYVERSGVLSQVNSSNPDDAGVAAPASTAGRPTAGVTTFRMGGR